MAKYILVCENKNSTQFLAFDEDDEYLNTFGYENQNALYYFQPLLSKAVKFDSLKEVSELQLTFQHRTHILEIV